MKLIQAPVNEPLDISSLVIVIVIVVILLIIVAIPIYSENRSKRKNETSAQSSPEAQTSTRSSEHEPKPVLTPARKASNQPGPSQAISGHIFVSYRRSDSADIAGRIYDRLTGKFGRGPIFKDVDSIPLGLDFKEFLDRKVSECNVLLAIIGDRWLEASDSTGKKRLDDPTDFVRIEIASALERGIPVIPLIVRGAYMPPEESLPNGLKKLAYRNGIHIRPDPDFHRDMDRLIAALEQYLE